MQWADVAILTGAQSKAMKDEDVTSYTVDRTRHRTWHWGFFGEHQAQQQVGRGGHRVGTETEERGYPGADTTESFSRTSGRTTSTKQYQGLAPLRGTPPPQGHTGRGAARANNGGHLAVAGAIDSGSTEENNTDYSRT